VVESFIEEAAGGAMFSSVLFQAVLHQTDVRTRHHDCYSPYLLFQVGGYYLEFV
jgi:hypothetical protein